MSIAPRTWDHGRGGAHRCRLRHQGPGGRDPDPRQPCLQGSQPRAGPEASRQDRRGAEAAAAAGTAEARPGEEGQDQGRETAQGACRRCERRCAHRARQGRLHQCHPGLPLHQGRPLPALRRAGPGHRHRARAGREAGLGLGRRHGALGGRRHHQRRGQGRHRPHPGEADRCGPADQPRHDNRPAHVPPGDALLRLDLHGVGVVDLSGLGAARPQEAARRGRCCRRRDRRRRHRHRAAQVPLPHRGRCALAAAARVRRRRQGLHSVPLRPRPERGAAAVRHRSRRQAGARQLPGARHHLHRRPPVRRRRAAARDGAAARGAHRPHRCRLAGDPSNDGPGSARATQSGPEGRAGNTGAAGAAAARDAHQPQGGHRRRRGPAVPHLLHRAPGPQAAQPARRRPAGALQRRAQAGHRCAVEAARQLRRREGRRRRPMPASSLPRRCCRSRC